MRTQLNKNLKASKHWEELSQLPCRGAGQNIKKFVFSWNGNAEKDDEHFGPSFWQEMKDMMITETKALTGIWCSKGRLSQLVGSDEADEMIDNSELPTKESKYGRTLYFWTEEKHERTKKFRTS